MSSHLNVVVLNGERRCWADGARMSDCRNHSLRWKRTFGSEDMKHLMGVRP